MDHDEGRSLQADGCFTEPGGYIQWGEWDVNTWEISRVPSAPSQSNDELENLRQWTSTLGKSKPGPSFISSGFVTFPFSALLSPLALLPFSSRHTPQKTPNDHADHASPKGGLPACLTPLPKTASPPSSWSAANSHPRLQPSYSIPG